MNHPTTPTPRWSCRLVRGWFALTEADATVPTSGPGARHVAACPDCQRHFGACDELASALRRDATRERAFTPAGLDERIVAAVHRSARPPRRAVFRPATVSLTAAAAACAALAFVFLSKPASPPTPAPAPDRAAVAGATAVAESLPADFWSTLQPRAAAILRQDPLQNEVDAVYADARSALRFLALNFLPTPLAAANGASSSEPRPPAVSG